jgi:Flp pilus assembly pilin Flp
MKTLLRQFGWRMQAGNEHGQTMVEYTVVLAVITAAIVATITLLSGTVTGMYSNVIGYL